MRHRLRTLLAVITLGLVVAGCIQVQEGGAGLGQPPASDDVIYYDPGPEFRAAKDAAAERAEGAR